MTLQVLRLDVISLLIVLVVIHHVYTHLCVAFFSTVMICMLPWIYPATIVANVRSITVSSDSILGSGFPSVLVALVLWFVSIDVLLGVVGAGEPTSFVF